MVHWVGYMETHPLVPAPPTQLPHPGGPSFAKSLSSVQLARARRHPVLHPVRESQHLEGRSHNRSIVTALSFWGFFL